MEKRKKLLLIGDLKTANNYGAIAASECLIKMLEKNINKKFINYIDYRSFRRETPPNGWEEVKKTKLNYKKFVKKIVMIFFKKIGILNYIIYVRAKIIKDKFNNDHVPFRVSQFEKYAKEMMQGKRLKYEYSLINNSDIVIINGEGNIVNGTDKYGKYRIGARYILFMAYIAKKYFNKYVAIINHTVDPKNSDAEEMIKYVYPLLDYIAVREPLSIKELRRIGFKGKIVLAPDALFTFSYKCEWKPSTTLKNEINFGKEYICVGDSSALPKSKAKIRWNVEEVYIRMIKELQKIVPQVIFIDGFSESNENVNRVVRKMNIGRVSLKNCSYKDLFEVLKRSKVFISGRWHASILSVMSGTPIILFGADSHKTKGLKELIKYPIKFIEIETLPIHIDEIAEEAKSLISNNEIIRKKLIENIIVLKNEAYKNLAFLKTQNT